MGGIKLIQKNEEDISVKIDNEELKLRAIKLKEDYENLITFYDQIFEKELVAKGGSVKALLDEQLSFMPFFKFIGLFSKGFRHTFDGFLFENGDKEIISTVNVGYAGNFWEVAMVATHPEYRKKGLAKKLVQTSLEHAKNHGAKMCVLEVLEENIPAYQLYKKLGFVHFDSNLKMKLEKGEIKDKEIVKIPSKYTLKSRKNTKQENIAMYNLEKKVTPDDVQTFLPVNKIKYIKPFLIKLVRPIARLFIKKRSKRWLIYHDDEELVAILYILLGNSKDDCHTIDFIIDPDHCQNINQFIINFSKNYLIEHAEFELNTLITIKKSEKHLREALLNSGFSVFESYQIMGIKFE
ncbi:MAG: GNAT family N-acetyltransferase [Promethearchaeota archaeon]|nr:MAG: GNAT family N-acetyltransferase [Candidatus Lokiarchaeota archaeon]